MMIEQIVFKQLPASASFSSTRTEAKLLLSRKCCFFGFKQTQTSLNCSCSFIFKPLSPSGLHPVQAVSQMSIIQDLI